ncbi:MAG: hypothetical protein M3044_09750 [Thermoproteota archaeon]|nr:hypothetical protein [Thermoproteota archaeon]
MDNLSVFDFAFVTSALALTPTAFLTSQYIAFNVLSFAIQKAKAIRQIFFTSFSCRNMNFLKIFHFTYISIQARTEQNLARYFNLKNPRTKNIPSLSVRNQGLDSKLERVNGPLRDRA